ncbi:monovalent cation/H+ antiporter subunit D [Thermococcus eurythermalis]|uniref:Monovalent cation/H+ antiporter subunit D n=1 Tax=Thermococcus eurythermalis TaxID=1505907 RepID=A0A097QVV3_9EURY|nr:proton-conducting transporter membrane subunit [Thermococcus eurythermalis]AIU70604.1 monovalent cation/H+ antiporter subunit D [Thermococcus eurythermalis]
MNALILPTIPMAFAFALPVLSQILKGNRKFVNAYAMVVTGLTFVLSLDVFRAAYSSEKPLIYTFGGWKAPIGIIYEVDRFGALLALTTSFLMFIITFYSVRYLERETGVEWYYTLYLGLEAGLLGIFLTGDAFNLFVMLEVTAAAAYGLVMFYTEEGYPAYSGVRYAIISSIGTTFYFLALGVLYYGFDTVNFADLAAKARGYPFPVSEASGNLLMAFALAMALITWAFTIKSAIMPNHFWLPGAHSSAPSPISAVLSGLVVNAGIYGLARFIWLFTGVPEFENAVRAVSTVLIGLGAVSALLASLAMTAHDDVKRIVAYSTILHMGYLAMAVGLRTELGTKAMVFHMLNHSLGKALLFLAVGVFIHEAGSRKLQDLAGLGKKMPLTTVSLAIATISLVGLPPTNVFFSKLVLYYAYMEKSVALVVVLVLSSVFALVSYMKMLYWLWIKKAENSTDAKEPKSMVAVLLLLAVLCLAIGILSPLILEDVIDPTAVQALDVEGYIQAAINVLGGK